MRGPESTRGIRTRPSPLIWLIAVFIGFSFINSVTPPNGDDWAWGTSIGLERLHSGFANYNGRYAANVVMIVLIRTPWITPLIVGASLTAIIWCLVRLTGGRRIADYAVVTALLVAAPLGLWSQAIVWLSGVVNYQFSALFVLLFLLMVQREWFRPRPLGAVAIVGVTVAAVLASLFMETVTIFFVLASLGACLALRAMRRRWSSGMIAWFAGSTIGVTIMFSNGAYRRAAEGGDGYQQVGASDGLFAKAFDQVSTLLVVQNVVVNLAFTAVITAISLIAHRRSRRLADLVPLILVWGFLAVVIPLWTIAPALTAPVAVRNLAGVGVLLLVGAIAMTAARYLDPVARWRIVGAMIAVALLSAPTVVASPLAPRLFFVTYLLMIGMIVVLLRAAVDLAGAGRQSDAAPRSLVGALALAVTLALFVHYGTVYTVLGVREHQRVEFIREKVADGARSVTVAGLPFPAYLHTADPSSDLWNPRYKLFYGIPDDIRLRVK